MKFGKFFGNFKWYTFQYFDEKTSLDELEKAFQTLLEEA